MAQNVNSIEQLIASTDFALLKEQKKALFQVIADIDDVPVLEKLEGLVNFINSFQDMAVDVYGKDENEVFDLSDDSD